MSLMLPQGQKLLTNVSVVRMKKGKDRFEIATYPNTVISWRTGAEKDVREVLQIDRVFRNVELDISLSGFQLQISVFKVFLYPTPTLRTYRERIKSLTKSPCTG